MQDLELSVQRAWGTAMIWIANPEYLWSMPGLGNLGAASDAGEAAGESFTIQLFFIRELFSRGCFWQKGYA